MIQSKLIQLLRTLSSSEMKKLGQFLQSPYHNQNKKVIFLYDLLKRYHEKNYQSNRIQKETFFYKIFPQGTKYQDNNMRGLMAALHRCVEDFLMLEALQSEQQMQQSLKKKVYNQKKLYHRYEKLSLKTIAQKKEQTSLELFDTYQAFKLHYDYYFHAQTNKFRKGAPILEACMIQLDLFYLQGKLQLSLEMRNREQIFKEKYDIFLWAVINEKLSKNKLLYQPTFRLYQDCIQLINCFDDHLFQQTVEYLEEYIEQIGQWEKKAFIALFFNFVNRQIRQGNFKNYSLKHRIAKFGLKHHAFIINGLIPSSLFLSTITTALNLKEFNWASDFLTKYQQNLALTNRSNIIEIGKICINLQKGVYFRDNALLDKALSLFRKIKEPHLLYDRFLRIVRLRLYYEYYLQDDKNLHFFLDAVNAFQKYLGRVQSYSDAQKRPYQNFNLVVKKLALLKCTNNKKIVAIANLTKEIEEHQSLESKFWLLEKVSELRQPPSRVRSHP